MAKKKVVDKGDESSKNNDSDVSSSEEPNFSDPEGFVDDIDDSVLLEDILKQQPKETDGFESVIVIDGTPQVGPDRFEKLKSVITKMFSKFGNIVNEHYPKNSEGVTKGYIFLEFSNPNHAAEAVKLTNNLKLDKQHTFQVNLLTDISKIDNIEDDWKPPQPMPYEDQSDLHYYRLEPDAFDQYAIVIAATEARPEVHIQIWQNTLPEPTVIADRGGWTQSYIKWSPLGTYLLTFHKAGTALWAGPEFTQFRKFAQEGVQYVDFSPCEKYLVTYAPQGDPRKPEQKKIIIWDIRTGQEKRSFNPEGPTNWPIFKWSHDDKYFGRVGNDVLSIYETPSFGLLDKKSIKINGIKDFNWSPTDNIIAYWVAEDKDVPASVTLLELPNRNEIRKKNLFNVADCRIHWQKSGDYLCVKVDRYAKMLRKEKNEMKYSGMYCNFEIFHIREKQVPVDSVEIKEPIQAFAWEPVGTKFAMIHGESPNISVSFYEVKIGLAPILLKKFEKRSCTHLFWSPNGQYIVLAGFGSPSGGGSLEFVDTHEFLVMNSTEHFQMSNCEWDPTGRYVFTGVSHWKVKVDNGFWMWSFQGKILKRTILERFAEILWRPRPPTLLTEKQQKEIKKNLKRYYAQFESKDRMRQTKASKELVEKRKALMKEFNELREKQIKRWEETKSRRLALRNNVDTDELGADTDNVEEEVVEFFVKEEIILID